MNKLEPKVEKLADAMSRFYQDEDGRWDKGLCLLNDIFGRPPITTASIGKARSDGHSITSHNGPVITVVFKNEVTGINALPHVEAVGYVAHLHECMDGEWFERWRMPCLGIIIVGYEITFHGIVSLGHRYRVVNLTPGLPCLEHGSDGQDREALHKAPAAAPEPQAHILSDIHCYTSSPPPKILKGTFRFPAVSELRRRGTPGSTRFQIGSIRFQIYEYYHVRESYRQLYFAHRVDVPDVPIVIKFSRTYCIDLHEYCFLKGHAPKILGFELLPGGWYGIAMEYLANAVHIQSAQPGLTAQLTQLVDGFGKEGYVHGDLRDANILCEGDQFWLVDFDWGGKDREAEYPTSNLNVELLKGRSHQDLKIRREDDVRILRNTLDKLKTRVH